MNKNEQYSVGVHVHETNRCDFAVDRFQRKAWQLAPLKGGRLAPRTLLAGCGEISDPRYYIPFQCACSSPSEPRLKSEQVTCSWFIRF